MFFLLNIVPPRASWESSIYNVLYDYVIVRVLGPKPISIGSIGGDNIINTYIICTTCQWACHQGTFHILPFQMPDCIKVYHLFSHFRVDVVKLSV